MARHDCKHRIAIHSRNLKKNTFISRHLNLGPLSTSLLKRQGNTFIDVERVSEKNGNTFIDVEHDSEKNGNTFIDVEHDS